MSTSAVPTGAPTRDTAVGLTSALIAFLLWGLFPLYWRQLEWVPALQLVVHRAFWGAFFCFGFSLLLGQGRMILQLCTQRRTRRWLAISASLLSINFLTFIYAVEAERVVEVSLGYFLNPVLNVLLGVVVLREQLTRLGWLATALASAGVIVMASASEEWPWIALTLAFAFGLYGLVRKTIAVDAVAGNTVEMGLMSLPAGVALISFELAGEGQLAAAGLAEWVWLLSTGLATALPLWAFTAAARRLALSTIGFMQYLAPTLQLATAVIVFDESFTPRHGLAFSLIWASLALFAWSRTREARSARRARSPGRTPVLTGPSQGVVSATGEG